MRKLLLLLVAVFTMFVSFAQSTANYSFTTSTTGSLALDANSNAIDMTTGTTQVLATNTSQDQAINSTAITFPSSFEFYLGGTRFTSFFATSNGLVQLGSTAVISSSTYTAGGGTLAAPRLSAFNGDLGTGTSGGIFGKLIGTAPNRCYVIEFRNMNLMWDTYTNDGTYQVRLYENTGVIEYVYGSMYCNTTVSTADATPEVGFSWGSSANQSLSINISTLAVDRTGTMLQNTVTAGTNITNLNSSSNGSRRVFTFTPPSTSVSTPTTISFSPVALTSMTVNWTDASSNELNFIFYRATDASFTQNVVISTISSTTSAGTGTVYSSSQTGLLPGNVYYYKVIAVSEGVPSSALTGNQSTNAATVKNAVGNGNWSSTTIGAPWADGVVPVSTDDVTINDGVTVTIDVAGTCNNLTVGQGASGVLQFEQTTARTLTIVQNVTIAVGGTFQSNAAGTVTTHSLSIGGNLTNNGTLDFSTNSNTAAASITFTGTSNNTFSGTGGTTDVRGITINKGSSTVSTSSPVLDMSVSNFSVRGLTTDPVGFLTLSNGIFKISGSNTCSSVVFITTGYSIASTAGFWLNNANFTVTGLNGSPTMSGLLRISAGIYNVGTASSNAMSGASTSIFVFEGGTANFTGRLNTSSAVSFTMTAGTINVCTIGNSSSSTPSFGLTSTSASVTISGGTINLVQASTATTPYDYQVSATSPNITGGTLNVGTAATATNFNFRLSGATPSLVVDNTTNNKTATLFASVTAYGNITINTGTTANLNGFTLQTRSTTITNNGTLTGTTTSSRLSFFSPTNAAQSFTGSGTVTSPLDGLSVQTTGGLTISHTNSFNTLRVNLFAGTITNSNKISLGSGGSSAVTVQVGSSGNTTLGGSFDVAPTFNLGTGTYTVTYQQETGGRTTGLEIPSSRSINFLTINNTNGLTISGGTLTITGSTGLALTAGVITTTQANRLILASTVTTIPTGSTSSYISGPLEIQTAATATDISRTFPIGISGAYRPLSINTFTNNNSAQNYVAEAINGSTGGSGTGINLTQARYYRVQNIANIGSASTARIVLTYGNDDNIGSVSSAVIAQASTPTSTSYANQGQSANTASTVTSNAATATISSGGEYFVIASTASLPITWDGGAGTNNWGDAANWNPDGVPTSSSNVNLTQASVTTININGTYDVADLTLGSNVTLNLSSNIFTVNGNYTQTGSTFDLGSGTLNLLGGFTKSSGTLTSGTSTTNISGATQAINATSSATTFNNLSLSGGTKTFTTGATYAVAGNLNVASDAVLNLSSATSTTINVTGNLTYSAATGGTNISSLILNLAGTNNTISAGTGLAIPNITVATSSVYGLSTNLEVPTGRTLTLNGTLNLANNVLSGAGSFTSASTGRLGTTASTASIDGVIVNTTSKTYTSGLIIDYNGSNQTINSATHPANAMVYISGSGTKTLNGNILVSGTSGSASTKGALYVNAGATFADGGFAVSLTGSYGNIIVEGTYLSTGSGKISYGTSPTASKIRAVDGTVFGDLEIGFSTSTSAISLEAQPASSSVGITFRNYTTNGTGGGTLTLNSIGTTNVTITGNVSLAPTTITNTGGGFGGTSSTTGTVRVKGNITTTSTSTSQTVLNSTGTNTLILDGSSGAQTITLGANSTSFLSGATLRVENINGLNLGSALTIAGTLNMVAGTLTTGANNLTLGTSGSLTLAASATLNISGGTTNFANRPVTLQSNASSTARIATILGTLSNASAVTVQRYIPGGRRAFRFFGHPFTAAIPLSQLMATSGANTGIDITGNGGATNGFTTTSTNNPSAFSYSPATGNIGNNPDPGWSEFASASTSSWASKQGIRVLVRGTKGEGLDGNTYSPSATTVSMTGTLNDGSSPVATLSLALNSGFNLIANPLASQIDLSSAGVTRGSNINANFSVWNPNTSTRGAYETYAFSTPYVLPIGGAFFTQTADGTTGNTITFAESAKTATAPASGTQSLFRTSSTDDRLTLQLNDGTGSYTDRLQLLLNNQTYTSGYDNLWDATKLMNPDINLYSFSSDSKKLAIDRRPAAMQTIPLGITVTQNGNYSFVVTDLPINSTYNYYLKDRYLNTETLLQVNTTVSFAVSSDASTQGDNRFELVMRSSNALPVTFLSVTAAQKNAGIEVSWNTVNEVNMSSYEVEESKDGISFTKAITVAAKNATTNNYSWLDASLINGDNYYRIKAVENNGTIKYSNVVKVKIGGKGSEFIVYPNPVKGGVVSVQMSNIEKGIYTVKIFNNIGQELANKTINHNGGSATQTIDLGKTVAAGTYKMYISNGTTSITKTVIVE